MGVFFWFYSFFSLLFFLIFSNQIIGSGQDTNRLVCYVAMGLMGVFLGFFTISQKKLFIPPVAKVSIALTILAIGSAISNRQDQWQFYMSMYGVMFSLSMIFSANIMRSPLISEKKFLDWVGFLLLCTFSLTFFSSATAEDTQRYGIGINFYSVFGLPWIMLMKGWKRNLLFLMAIAIAVFSGKRSGIILVGMMPLLFLGYNVVFSGQKKSKSIVTGLFLGIAFLIALFFADTLSDGALLERFSGDALADGSGRGESLEAAISTAHAMSLNEWLFGADELTMMRAIESGFVGHNDLLVYFLNNGLLGLGIYLLLPLTLCIRFIKLHVKKSSLASPYLCFVVSLGLLSMISMVYQPGPGNIIWCMFAGWIEGLLHYRQTPSQKIKNPFKNENRNRIFGTPTLSQPRG